MQPGDAVTWIKVQKPVFDLAGVILSALGLTGILAAIALVLGAAFGTTLILRRRHQPPEPLSLGL